MIQRWGGRGGLFAAVYASDASLPETSTRLSTRLSTWQVVHTRTGRCGSTNGTTIWGRQRVNPRVAPQRASARAHARCMASTACKQPCRSARSVDRGEARQRTRYRARTAMRAKGAPAPVLQGTAQCRVGVNAPAFGPHAGAASTSSLLGRPGTEGDAAWAQIEDERRWRRAAKVAAPMRQAHATSEHVAPDAPATCCKSATHASRSAVLLARSMKLFSLP